MYSATLGSLGAWPDSPDMNATPAQLYAEYVAYMTPLNPNGAWKDLDPAYLGQYLWDQIHPPNLINTGQWGSDVAAIGYQGTTATAPATAWIQRQDGTVQEITQAGTAGAVLDRVPGSATPAEATAARAVQAELEVIRERGPIPEGFLLDPAVQAEWEAQNEGGTWWDRLTKPEGEPGELEGGAGGGLLTAGLGALALFLIAFPKRRRRR